MRPTTLWIAQAFLALFFLFAGLPKVVGRGIDKWVGFDGIPRPLTILIGTAELTGAVALIVPMAVDRWQFTTPLAALGLSVTTLMASGFHLRAAEVLPATETALWASLTGAVAIGRWGELSTGPSISRDLLVPVIAVLVPTIIAVLIVLIRRPVPTPPTDDVPTLTPAG
jgi:uncharacterized membrane protein YphA (DoxX/SURF4 family)